MEDKTCYGLSFGVAGSSDRDACMDKIIVLLRPIGTTGKSFLISGNRVKP